MMKKLEILGMALDNYTVQEAMLQVEGFLGSDIMNTVETISMDTLVRAQEDGQLRECIEGLDLTVVSDKEILKAAEAASPQRMQETADNLFQREFLKQASRNNRTVYLLGDDSLKLDALQGFLRENYSRIQVVGSYALADCLGDYDTVINEINIVEPDVLISVVSTPEQEYFLKANKEKLNVKIWYGLGENYVSKKGVSEVAGFAKKLIQKGVMHSMLARYNHDKDG
ncbi:MAG: glycosyltransferase [Lachnospiraceae bacterium]|nr:glycosyltransferase [Lachnospiraceae bacterium]